MYFYDELTKNNYLKNMRNLESNAKEGESKRYLAPRPGLEPGTCGLTVRRSTD